MTESPSFCQIFGVVSESCAPQLKYYFMFLMHGILRDCWRLKQDKDTRIQAKLEQGKQYVSLETMASPGSPPPSNLSLIPNRCMSKIDTINPHKIAMKGPFKSHRYLSWDPTNDSKFSIKTGHTTDSGNDIHISGQGFPIRAPPPTGHWRTLELFFSS